MVRLWEMRTLKIIIDDGSTQAALLCFNRPFLEDMAPVGATIQVYGRFQFNYGEIQSSSFEIKPLKGNATIEPSLVPVYPLTERLNQTKLRQ